jgi:hypothetical protein
VEGNGHGLILSIIQGFAWGTEENYEESKLG